MQGQKFFFLWRMVGTLAAGTIATITIGMGAWLVSKGASATGVSMMLAAAATVIGSALYGHSQKSSAGEKKSSGEE